jgi:hypothetical protein
MNITLKTFLALSISLASSSFFERVFEMASSYFDNTNSNLKYATNVSGFWLIQTLDSIGTVGVSSSIAIDLNNNIHISYYFMGMNSYVKHITNESGAWVVSNIDSLGVSSGQGFATSIAIDSNNKIHISYYDFTGGDLKYATNKSGQWIKTILDSDGDVGYYSSLSVDSNNKIHISYFDRTNRDLKYATDVTNLWVTTIIDSVGDTGRYTSLKLDSDNKVHISYMNYTNSDLIYTTNQSGDWIKNTVESTGDVGRFSSIRLDLDKNVHICYYDATKGCLKYAHTNSPTIVMNGINIPLHFDLKQNYPNPFNPSTTISLSLPSKLFVSLKIFDLIGREVATIVSEELSAGDHSRQWNTNGMPSGVYFYRLQAGSFTETKKLILLR